MRTNGVTRGLTMFAALLLCTAPMLAAVTGPIYPAPGGNNFANGSGDTGYLGGRTSAYSGFTSSAYGALYWGLSAAPALSFNGTSYEGNEPMTLLSRSGNVVVYSGQTTWCWSGNSLTYPIGTRLTLTATTGAGALNWVDSATVPEFGQAPGTGFSVLPVAGDFNVNFFFEAYNPLVGQWQPARSFFDGNTGYTRCNSALGLGRSTSGGFWYTAPAPTNQPPVLGAIGDKNVESGSLLSFTVSASDPDEEAVTLSSTALFPGATFNASTGAFRWTPLYGQVGDHSITFTATDPENAQDSEQITIHVTAPAGNVAPVLDPVGCRTVMAGSQVAFTLTAIDGNGDTPSFGASGLPAGATLNAGTGELSWTPSVGQAGLHEVTFFVSDGNLSDSETVSILVAQLGAEATSASIEFGIYNQGRGGALPSKVRAWVSDHAMLDSHVLGSGKDDVVPLTLLSAPAPGCDTPECIPPLQSGDTAQYSAAIELPPGAFGRHVLGDDAGLAVANGDDTFTLTATDSGSSAVSFLYGRYFWTEADAERDEAQNKLDESGQVVAELMSNDRGSAFVSVMPPQFGELAQLSANFSSASGSGGTPRLDVHLLCGGKIGIRLGSSPAFNDGGSSVNVIGNNDAGRYDLSALGGSDSATYADALAAAGEATVTRIAFVVDDEGDGPSRSYSLTEISVATGPVTVPATFVRTFESTANNSGVGGGVSYGVAYAGQSWTSSNDMRGVAEFTIGSQPAASALLKMWSQNIQYGSNFDVVVEAYLGNGQPDYFSDFQAPTIATIAQFPRDQYVGLNVTVTLDVTAAYNQAVGAGAVALGIRIRQVDESGTGQGAVYYEALRLEVTGGSSISSSAQSTSASPGKRTGAAAPRGR